MQKAAASCQTAGKTPVQHYAVDAIAFNKPDL
jgi:hypothetical protein